MKASELIVELHRAIAEHGDLDVAVEYVFHDAPYAAELRPPIEVKKRSPDDHPELGDTFLILR